MEEGSFWLGLLLFRPPAFSLGKWRHGEKRRPLLPRDIITRSFLEGRKGSLAGCPLRRCRKWSKWHNLEERKGKKELLGRLRCSVRFRATAWGVGQKKTADQQSPLPRFCEEEESPGIRENSSAISNLAKRRESPLLILVRWRRRARPPNRRRRRIDS